MHELVIRTGKSMAILAVACAWMTVAVGFFNYVRLFDDISGWGRPVDLLNAIIFPCAGMLVAGAMVHGLMAAALCIMETFTVNRALAWGVPSPLRVVKRGPAASGVPDGVPLVCESCGRIIHVKPEQAPTRKRCLICGGTLQAAGDNVAENPA